MRDHYAYNGSDLGSDNIVPDLALEARLTLTKEVETLAVRIQFRQRSLRGAYSRG